MGRPIRSCGLFLLFAFALSDAALPEQSIRFSRTGIQQGLSQSAVNCIFQDVQGFMWFGTQDGLNRYDGYTFRVFKHDPADTTSLNDNFIASIHEDSNGELWISTLNQPDFINKYNPLTESFDRIPVDSVDLNTARGSSVFATHVDDEGYKWSGSIGGGLTRTNLATGEKTKFTHDPANPGSLSDNRVYSVYGDRQGILWVGTREGLNRYDPATGSFIHYKNRPNDTHAIGDNWVWPLFEDRSGVLWVGTVRGGLHRFDRATGRFAQYTNDPANPRSISDNFILSIYQDRSGVMWVGTSNDGLNTFHPELNAFTHFAKDAAKPNSLIDNNITSILVDKSGVPWIGTRGGLARMDRRAGTFTHFTHDPANAASLAENATPAIYEDRAGALWLGTYSSGLDRFDRRTGNFTHFKRDPSRPGTLSDNRIYSIVEDSDGYLWLGTYGGGVNRFDRRTGEFKAYLQNDTVPTSIAANGAWALLVDRDDVLWVGTYGGGLNRFNKETETFTRFQHDRSNPESISDDVVVCMYEDRSGVLWVGTTGGLNRFDRSSGAFKRYREKDGLPNDVIFGILEDDHGNLWMSTNKGIARFNPRTEKFRSYDVNDGLQENEFNQNAYFRDPSTGEMYFGGVNGFNIFHPDSVRDNPYVPQVVFSAFRRYNTDDEEGKPIEEKGIPVRTAITLTYKDNIATFEFAALSFFNTAKNQYAYKLEGFSENWIQLGTDHRATFTNLDPGDYVLRVRGSNNDGVWNMDGASLSLLVTPPWWKTRWAYASYGIMFVGMLYGLRRFEINRREQKAQMREAELRAKAAEAEKRALAAENERKTKELEEARNLQLSMLPRDIPQLPHMEIAVFMKTATEVGGDYYDFHLAPEDGTLNIAFGDATGHGMQAGTIVTLMKGMFTSDAARMELQAFFNHCSRSIKGIRLGRLLMAFSMLRIKGHRVQFSSAGMPPLFIYRKTARRIDEVLLKGMPLGAMKNFPYAVQEEVLEPGDTLLLVSDGLPEQKNSNGEMFDYPRLNEIFLAAAESSPDDVIKQLVGACEGWMNGATQEDDITLMAINVKA